jgi:hypothetical protein
MFRNPKSPLIAIAAYFALVGVISVSMRLPAQTQANGGVGGARTTVVNTADNPVPVNVQNPLTIDTSTPLQVQVDTSSPLDVKVDNSTPVNVKVDGAAPVPVTEKRQYLNVSISASGNSGSGYIVPSGKTFVIQHVSGDALYLGGRVPLRAGVMAAKDGVTIYHRLPSTPANARVWDENGVYELQWSEQLDFAVTGPHQLIAFATFTSPTGTGSHSINLLVSGYLVDAQ